ncbi:hypothetical protein QTH87_15985 [Variovorax sp. J22P168]|uniref:hypothetical protein n=1 Tax=Variovorax jilinensis TaxID=3053513 RepID=UPI002576921B|nr:hypothetical protein [Variovorax sp. J22P168]MDM0013935.1 hypothetical protein [Variovorax sp. J22P168]
MNTRHSDTGAQTVAANERERDKLELQTRPRNLPAFSVELRAPMGFEFKVGQRFALDLPGIERQLESPTLDVPLKSADGSEVRAVPAATQRKVLLRAHYSGATVNVLVIAVSPTPISAGNRDAVWKEAAATARVVFGNAGP